MLTYADAAPGKVNRLKDQMQQRDSRIFASSLFKLTYADVS